MKKSREELDKLHKEKCRELKKVRAQIAADLGVDLKQRECTYEGYCSGTCPKCKSEEMMLNLAIMKRQMESADIKRRVATAGLTAAAALSLTGCNTTTSTTLEGDVEVVPTVEELSGNVEFVPTTEELSGDVEVLPSPDTEDIQGGIEYIEPESSEEWELSGDVVIQEDTKEGKINE